MTSASSRWEQMAREHVGYDLQPSIVLSRCLNWLMGVGSQLGSNRKGRKMVELQKLYCSDEVVKE